MQGLQLGLRFFLELGSVAVVVAYIRVKPSVLYIQHRGFMPCHVLRV